jgi:hypothetical protein
MVETLAPVGCGVNDIIAKNLFDRKALKSHETPKKKFVKIWRASSKAIENTRVFPVS